MDIIGTSASGTVIRHLLDLGDQPVEVGTLAWMKHPLSHPRLDLCQFVLRPR